MKRGFFLLNTVSAKAVLDLVSRVHLASFVIICYRATRIVEVVHVHQFFLISHNPYWALPGMFVLGFSLPWFSPSSFPFHIALPHDGHNICTACWCICRFIPFERYFCLFIYIYIYIYICSYTPLDICCFPHSVRVFSLPPVKVNPPWLSAVVPRSCEAAVFVRPPFTFTGKGVDVMIYLSHTTFPSE